MTTRYSDLTTDKARIAFIREKLESDDQWILRAMHTIYQRQTADEQNTEQTRYTNGIGFTGVDAELLTSFTKRMIERGYLKLLTEKKAVNIRTFFSQKQEYYIRRKVPKYSRQLVKITKGLA